MATIYTIEGPGRRRASNLRDDGGGCRRVKHGKKRGCTIALCPGKNKNGRSVMKFKKGSVRCG